MFVVIDYSAHRVDEDYSITDWLNMRQVSYYRMYPDSDPPSNATKVLISGGPVHSSKCERTINLVRCLKVPIFGICLGCMCIVEAYGGRMEDCGQFHSPMKVKLFRDDILSGVDASVIVGHRQKIAEVGSELLVTGLSDSGEIMAVRHKTKPIEGVMFHPESPRTELGNELLDGFLNL